MGYVKNIDLDQPEGPGTGVPIGSGPVTEIVFNEKPTKSELKKAINEAVSAAFSTSGVLRIRGSKNHC